MLVTILVVLVAGYGLVVGGLYLFQRKLIYLPDRARPELGTLTAIGARAETLQSADGLPLLSWYVPAKQGQPTIAYFHGNGGNIGYRAERMRLFAGAGYGILLLGYRGYGGNPGSPSEAGLYEDAEAALAFLAAEHVPPARQVLYGESLGTGVAVEMAARHRAGALILEASYSRLPDVAQYHYPLIPAAWLVTERFDSVAKIGRVTAPILILHGEQDSIIPVRFARALLAAAPEPKEGWFARQGGHADLRHWGGLDRALAFIRERLG